MYLTKEQTRSVKNIAIGQIHRLLDVQVIYSIFFSFFMKSIGLGHAIFQLCTFNVERWGDVPRATFGSLPWRSRSQHDLAAKSCPPHNLVIWSLILQLFHKKITILRRRVAHNILVDTLKIVTAWLQQNHVRPISLLFEVGFYKYFTEMITILRLFVTTLPIVWLCAYYTALY